MNLTIRTRLYILSFIPLLLMAIGVMGVAYVKTTNLTAQQVEVTSSTMMLQKKSELKTYVQMAKSAVQPFLTRGASLEEALPTLRELEYGSDGYIFGYDSKGIRIVMGKHDKGIGESYFDLQDQQGNYLIRELITNAKTGDYTTYYFPKPGETKALPKLSYSIYIPEWDLMLGTGFYTDDIDAVIADMNSNANSALENTLAAIAMFCFAI
ncbi:MAG TPA: chemotaxis protein, partial [Vibrio sp.]|nr:chemotaxis protein [Vibrio sp.]